MYFVYVAQSINTPSYLYKGHCENLHVRLHQHNSGQTKSNSPYIPLRIIYYESFDTLEASVKCEKYWKTAAGRRYLQRMATTGPVVQWIE
jgi:putative endonuclease